MIDLALRQRGAFSPRLLFTKGEAGAWYDPGDLSSMSQDSSGAVPAAVGQPVGRIGDKSGRGNHAVQSVAAARPMLRQDSGGALYLEFDGVDDCLKAVFAIAQPWERVSAIRQLSWTGADRALGGGNVSAGVLYQVVGSPVLRMHSGADLELAPDLAIGTTGVVSERHDGTASRIALNNGAPAIGNAGTVAPGGVTLGANFGGNANGNVRIYGLVVVGRILKDSEAARLRRFMANRAGVAL